jgi:hypothetical protein
MTDRPPYLSIVVTSRNDDHGGGLLRRMQIFVNGVIEQCRRHGLDAELIIVEWNPPPERPRLVEALRWPAEFGSCRVRIIEVPPERHRWFQYSEVLPLFQMIAKNVGIRRARGRFVLATNVDIVFSDELMAFLAARRLEKDRLYRIDRHDVMAEVPAEGTLDEQLAYCRTHLLRIHTWEGSFSLEPDGRRALERVDVADPDSGVRFGRGWFQVCTTREPSGVVYWRGAAPKAELVVTMTDMVPPALALELEPGPSCKGGFAELEIRDTSERLVAKGTIRGKQWISVGLPLESHRTHVLTLCSAGEGRPIPGDPRVVTLRLFWCGRSKAEYQRILALRDAKHLHDTEAEAVVESLERAGPARAFTPVGDGVVSPALLHTNGCGDFTLLSREKWFDIRGYPQFRIFSFHLDSVLCYAAHHAGAAEAVLAEPMRIYHIEHGVGSGWTPEGQAALFDRLAAKGIPCLDNRLVMEWATRMRQYGAPMIFNRSDWGLADAELQEAIPG